jgi:hypothetical protein
MERILTGRKHRDLYRRLKNIILSSISSTFALGNVRVLFYVIKINTHTLFSSNGRCMKSSEMVMNSKKTFCEYCNYCHVHQLPVLIKLLVSASRIIYKKYLSFPENLSMCTSGDSRHISLMMETETSDLCTQLMKIFP